MRFVHRCSRSLFCFSIRKKASSRAGPALIGLVEEPLPKFIKSSWRKGSIWHRHYRRVGCFRAGARWSSDGRRGDRCCRSRWRWVGWTKIIRTPKHSAKTCWFCVCCSTHRNFARATAVVGRQTSFIRAWQTTFSVLWVRTDVDRIRIDGGIGQ